MRPNNRFCWRIIALFTALVPSIALGGGFSTRDLNPILQPIYLPSRILGPVEDGWRMDHALYITNTLQQQRNSSENLLIDVENYRYRLDFGYRRQHWITHISVPLLANRGGELDSLIDDWHSFFGLSEGNRDKFASDQIRIEYQRDGIVEYRQTRSSSGLGDIAVVLGYQPADAFGYFFGIELATGSRTNFSGNEAIDYAAWIAREKQFNPQISLFGMLGLSFPGDGGDLAGLVVDRIWIAQLGVDYRLTSNLIATAQLDVHTKTIDDSGLKAFGESFQIQLGLGFPNLIDRHRIDLFFSEDILVGSAPDITFGLNLAREF